MTTASRIAASTIFVIGATVAHAQDASLSIAKVDAGPVGSLDPAGYVVADNVLPFTSEQTGQWSDGGVITYTFTVVNTGDVNMTDVEPVEAGVEIDGAPGTGTLSGFTIVSQAGFVDTDLNGDDRVDTLAPNEQALFTATYAMSDADYAAMINAASPATAVTNSATATGVPAAGVLAAVTASETATGLAPYQPTLPTAVCETGYASWGYVTTVNNPEDNPNRGVNAYPNAGWIYDANGLPIRAQTPAVTGTIVGQLPEYTNENNTRAIETHLAVTYLTGDAGTEETVTMVDPASLEHKVYAVFDGNGNLLSDSVGTPAQLPAGGNNSIYGANSDDYDLTFVVPADGNYYVYSWMVDYDQAGTISFINCQPPVAEDDEFDDGAAIGDTVTGLDILDNDTVGDTDLDPTSVVFTLTGLPADATLSDDGKTLTVPGEGVWTVDDDGLVSFDPEDDFEQNPTPPSYTVDDEDGDTSNEATITLIYNTAAVSGTVFLDNDASDTFDPADGEVGLGGYTVNLYDPSGVLVGTAVTGTDGTYQIAGFVPEAGDYTIEFVDPDSVTINSYPLGVDFTTDPIQTDIDQPILPTDTPDVTLEKIASVASVVIGETVTYTITATNLGATAYTPLTIIDTLPTGLTYTPGTATVDGVAVEPDVTGAGTLTWDGLTLAAGIGSTIEVTLDARVSASAPYGSLVNTANLLDENTDEPITSAATAVVTLAPEAVFDCTALIGKVFDDRNMNGYQDQIGSAPVVSTRGITDQSFITGKFSNDLVERDESEPGLPYVRLATPTGTIITTDQFGRFSVPCAELPGDLGTNFSLKLDTRSLPTGYRVTTENPRTMRLTAGIFTEMNFGASIGRIVDVDLTDAAFAPGADTPGEALATGVTGLLQQIADTPSMLRISYFITGSEDARVARDRMDAVEALIRNQWRDVGEYRLVIERTVKQFQ
ncbi:isopeptide-forming domain-containing fimbrial protein [Yoonia sp. BS5-3]|uniref:Isopeptide-forming domain-containing fimbrial protein n=1 Tax=Yoonia phaeophyticola TaxID=3137369 RepID=A0ABZ2V660_9RHOB